jgi:hypothetical protein
MTEKSFQNWLERYLFSQEQYNLKVIKELFTEDAVYWWDPFEEPSNGILSIYKHHRNILSHQEEVEYKYEILAVSNSRGIAKFNLALNDLILNEPDTYEGILLAHLNDENKCIQLKRWYNSCSMQIKK